MGETLTPAAELAEVREPGGTGKVGRPAVSEPEVRVVDNPARGRYEALIGNDLAGFAAYERHGDVVVFTHTRIEPAFEGRGVGGRLAAGALDDVRARGLAIVPRCPFIAEYVRRHPAYADLVASEPLG
jgi:predicted GNAT family acetyltransferase